MRPTEAHDRVIQLLGTVPHRRIVHAPARTAAAIAVQRGTPLELGAKALVFQTRHGGVLLVLRACDVVHGNTFRKAIGVRRLRFATADELRDHTGLEPGCVPPFGPPVFDLPLHVDPAVLDQERLVFTAARHDLSIEMGVQDWAALARPRVVPAVMRGS